MRGAAPQHMDMDERGVMTSNAQSSTTTTQYSYQSVALSNDGDEKKNNSLLFGNEMKIQ